MSKWGYWQGGCFSHAEGGTYKIFEGSFNAGYVKPIFY